MSARLSLLRSGDPVPTTEEGPRENVANALQLLLAHEAEHPTVWQFSPELRAVEARLFHALYQLDGSE